MKQLLPGHYCGQTVKSHSLAGFILSETRYPAGLRIPDHSHENAYFCLIREGSYSESYAGRRRECRPSSLVFHPPGEVHDERFHQEVLSFNVEFQPERLGQLETRSRLFESCAEVHTGRATWLGLQLYQEFRAPDEFSELAVYGLVCEIIAETARANHAGKTKAPRWLERARVVLHDVFPETPSLEQLAREVGVHPVHLASEFRKAFGCPVGEYLRRLRVEFACRELRASRLSLVEIALEAGFADQSHFSRTFKRLTGFSPAAYRSLHLAGGRSGPANCRLRSD